MTLEGLKVGAELGGVVRNVVDFGAFVDIGVGCDGLLHISKFPRGGGRGGAAPPPLQVGTRLRVRVCALEIQDLKRKKGRVSLEPVV